MTSFTTFVHLTGSTYSQGDDIQYLRKIIQVIYANHAMVVRDWIDAVHTSENVDISNNNADWTNIMRENIAAIERAHIVIVEASQSRFTNGFQTYLASQYKKPTLVVTRSETKNRYISGVESKYITLKHYNDEEELETIVSKFIKHHMIAENNLRFNMLLDRRIFKYLRDKSYETGKNKSEIIRELLEQEIKRREN